MTTHLMALSKQGQLYLSLDEMRTIQAHFVELGREPTDAELETLAQTWSEHCSHKTLRGRVEFEGEVIDNLLKQTIFKATTDLKLDWLVSVFADNAGVVRFDDEYDVCFKVETHNHPSAIDPYGGSNTGLGGVIRDALGTGLGAKPICNTDVFCVAPPDYPADRLPAGVLHPKRVLKGVVAGVRDYGNRMGIPTVNGALVVDPGYLANPLVFCGTVGVIPRGMSSKIGRARRPDRRPRRPDGPRRHPRRDVQLGRADGREREPLRRRRADRQRDHREDGPRRRPPGPRRRPLPRDHRLRGGGVQLGRRRDGGRDRGRRRPGKRPAQV